MRSNMQIEKTNGFFKTVKLGIYVQVSLSWKKTDAQIHNQCLTNEGSIDYTPALL